MDVEVIINNGQLKVLEIDARLPSQTPITVYQSTGINMLAHLADIYVYDRLPEVKKPLANKHVIFEHISVSPRKMETLGEHIMGEAGPLQLIENFFGADEAITNYCPDREAWAAALIISAASKKDVWDKRSVILRNIMEEHKISSYNDSFPRF
jgi:pyrrolysine biosynthesis protein PylC